jgi:uncharacterized protein
MNTLSLEAATKLRRLRVHRLIRQLHVWIGAWGAIAAVLFGVTGFLQNHRALLKLPQGSATEVAHEEISVPEEARASAESLRAWLARSQHLQLQIQRGPQGGNSRGPGWMLVGGNARTALQAEYTPGSETVTLRSTVQNPLAVLSRLHKGIGGGIAWILLSDSFAVGLVALGLSGLILWSRGRSLRQMMVSIAAVAAAVLVLVGGSAML